MRKLLYKSGTAIGLALLSPAALAATRDEVQTLLFGQVQIYVLHCIRDHRRRRRVLQEMARG